MGASLWTDEIYATSHYLGSFASLAGSLVLEGVLPCYYVFMYFWIKCFGDGEWSVRMPALLAGMGCIGLVYPLARRVSDRTTALAAAAWLALSPTHAWYSAEARPYSPWMTASAAALYA